MLRVQQPANATADKCSQQYQLPALVELACCLVEPVCQAGTHRLLWVGCQGPHPPLRHVSFIQRLLLLLIATQRRRQALPPLEACLLILLIIILFAAALPRVENAAL